MAEHAAFRPVLRSLPATTGEESFHGNTWGYKKYENGTIFNATIGNQTYYFRSVGEPTKVTQVHVKLKEVVKSYNICLLYTSVLVQLEAKMAAYGNGPWYVDSRDGVIYIHNRKF